MKEINELPEELKIAAQALLGKISELRQAAEVFAGKVHEYKQIETFPYSYKSMCELEKFFIVQDKLEKLEAELNETLNKE